VTLTADHDQAIAALEATGDYRVLRRLKPRPFIHRPDGSPTKLGLFLDLETTGLDAAKDEIIEIAMVPFNYGLDGRIFEIGKPFQRLRQPSNPIPPEITELTGITDAMVAGQVIDPAEVTAFAAPAALIVAHNAAFDRGFAERFCETFTTKPWACSMSQVPWAAEGFDGTKLSYLLAGCGLFHGAHRAADDCLAAIEILARPLLKSGSLAFAKLLEEARKPTCRIWAENSPYDLKDQLKARGYRWNGDANGKPRAWYTDLPKDQVEAELQYLRSEIYQRNVQPRIVEMDAYDRFSDRC
jgi:DNA polymerase-3 subunit epsilon